VSPQQTFALSVGPSHKARPTYCREYTTAKVRYRDRKDAKRAKRGRINEHEPYLREYKCPHCGGWHLTSQQPRLQANREDTPHE
jgi:hypothetical protein